MSAFCMNDAERLVTMAVQDSLDIEQLVSRFATSFDIKDWEGLRDCLVESVFTDYTDLRGTPPVTVDSDKYVESRRLSLEGVITHHLAGNYEIAYKDARNATCRASMIIWRTSDEGHFTSHCVYLFRLEKSVAGWKISG